VISARERIMGKYRGEIMSLRVPWIAKGHQGNFYIGCPICQDDLSESRCKPWNAGDWGTWRSSLKCSMLPDELFVEAVKEVIEIRGGGWAAASRWDVACILAGHPEAVCTGPGTSDFPAIPPKLVLAKARRLVRRRLLEGCYCGCRGDFTPC